MNKLLYIALVVFLFAASCTQREESVIDLSDIIAESDRYKEGEQKEVEVENPNDSLEILLDNYAENGLDVASITVLEKKMFPDRFGPLASRSSQLNFENDTVLFYNWSFADSAKTINAFFNWMDNFGTKHTSIYVGEEKKLQKEPLLLFVGDTSLIYIEARESLSQSQWENYLKNLGYAIDWNFVLQQRKWGEVKWGE
ncbi:MAG: hypothetical protein COA33_010740 [Fluviicola sp.]|nr:hypothetical protein [Fluviicola sp.]